MCACDRRVSRAQKLVPGTGRSSRVAACSAAVSKHAAELTGMDRFSARKPRMSAARVVEYQRATEGAIESPAVSATQGRWDKHLPTRSVRLCGCRGAGSDGLRAPVRARPKCDRHVKRGWPAARNRQPICAMSIQWAHRGIAAAPGGSQRAVLRLTCWPAQSPGTTHQRESFQSTRTTTRSLSWRT